MRAALELEAQHSGAGGGCHGVCGDKSPPCAPRRSGKNSAWPLVHAQKVLWFLGYF